MSRIKEICKHLGKHKIKLIDFLNYLRKEYIKKEIKNIPYLKNYIEKLSKTVLKL